MSKDTELPAETTTEGQENLKLWKSVDKTPPSMTKDVKYGGRKYTAIDPQWQLRVATSLWGPYGDRWGLRNLNYQLAEVNAQDAQGHYMATAVILKAEFFYPLDGKEVAFEILNEDKFKAGDDTLKKLVTNTRSKALSQLGFSADVFLGKFDDERYVTNLKEIFNDQDAFMNTIATSIRTAKDMESLMKYKSRLEEIIGDGTLDNVAAAQELMGLIAERKRELTAKS